MRDQLLGYLLGSLEPEEREQVENHLAHDPQLQRDLELLHESLLPLEADREFIEPPPGLAARTCSYVSHQAQTLTLRESWANRTGWQMQDMVVAAGIVVAASLFFFPAINHSRYQAQLATCQNNLRMIGNGLINYSQYHANYFPYVAPGGNLSSPSVFATTLNGTGFVSGSQAFFCPSSEQACERTFDIPTVEELKNATKQQLAELHRRLGGSYSSTYGYVEDGRYHGTRNLGRTHFALVADSPCPELDERQSANHGGRGQNVLFEDGHVSFLANCRCDEGDDIYRNDSGLVAAGTHVDDSVITWRPLQPVGE